MRYAMVIVKPHAEWQALSDTEGDFYSIVHWGTELKARGKVVAGAELAAPRTAASLSWPDEQAIVTDQPCLEGTGTVAGFLILSVDSANEAMEIANSWPNKAGVRIEVRPVVGNW